MKHIKLFESFDVEKEIENLENAYKIGYDSFQIYQKLDPEKQRIWVEELDRPLQKNRDLSGSIEPTWSKMGTGERIEFMKKGIKRKGFNDAKAGKEPNFFNGDFLKVLIPKLLDAKLI